MEDPKITKQTDEDRDVKFEKRNILKNIILVSFVWTLNFTAFIGLSQLQSSLHTEDGIGTVTQTVLYAGFVLSCLFVPKIMINQFGHKWSMAIAIVGYILWDAANG